MILGKMSVYLPSNTLAKNMFNISVYMEDSVAVAPVAVAPVAVVDW